MATPSTTTSSPRGTPARRLRWSGTASTEGWSATPAATTRPSPGGAPRSAPDHRLPWAPAGGSTLQPTGLPRGRAERAVMVCALVDESRRQQRGSPAQGEGRPAATDTDDQGARRRTARADRRSRCRRPRPVRRRGARRDPAGHRYERVGGHAARRARPCVGDAQRRHCGEPGLEPIVGPHCLDGRSAALERRHIDGDACVDRDRVRSRAGRRNARCLPGARTGTRLGRASERRVYR